MDNAMYITLSRQRALFEQMDIIANNVANTNTTGYKADQTLFHNYVMQAAGSNEAPLSYVSNLSTYTDMQEGGLQQTSRPLDMAIAGNGYFMVETPLGQRLTRAGNFRVDTTGQLTTSQGYPVLGLGGEAITFQQEDREVNIDHEGRVSVDGEERGQIGIFTVPDPRMLRKFANGLYHAEGLTPEPAQQYQVLQGMLEGSNVSSMKEMTRMVEVSRGVGTTSSLLASLQDLQSETVRRLADQR
ncbi:MAG: flagellar basal-body rod protein FlgF [Rickettsiales bacterium]|jgi:flagellar basal-body rod protein FlgF/flagellar basal-body rod protein FlgG|nr:flagellar basal-body rod protein FlgF [Rickettsiales bacterium]